MAGKTEKVGPGIGASVTEKFLRKQEELLPREDDGANPKTLMGRLKVPMFSVIPGGGGGLLRRRHAVWRLRGAPEGMAVFGYGRIIGATSLSRQVHMSMPQSGTSCSSGMGRTTTRAARCRISLRRLLHSVF